MEGPGGYQFVGRTLQVWNRYHVTREFPKSWLLRFFDQIRFYEVSEDQLLAMREDFPRGRCHIEIEDTTFSLARYDRSVAENRDDIAAFKARQQAAFDAERRRWAVAGQADTVLVDAKADEREALSLADGEIAIESHVHGMDWQLSVAEGESVQAGQKLLVLEFMKTELTIAASAAGRVARVLCREGVPVTPGQSLLVIESIG
jgi:urea carboxylase